MLFKIIDGEVITDVNSIVGISNRNNKVVIVSQIPRNSEVFLVIKGFNQDVYVPLYCVGEDEEGNLFENKIRFTRTQVNYIITHPTQVYECSVLVNKELIKDLFKFTVYSNIIAEANKGSEAYLELCAKVSDLSAQIYNMQKDFPRFDNTVDLKKGMVPVATGVNNEYVWDYPMSKFYNLLKNTASLCNELSNEVVKLTNKVAELEETVNDHIYEQYNI